MTLPTGVEIPAHVRAVAETDYATTLVRRGREHQDRRAPALGAPRLRGGNLLIKVHGEIPVLDGSALEFCKILEEIGVDRAGRAAARRSSSTAATRCNGGGEKILAIEPADGFSVSYLLRYPPPVGEQALRVHPDLGRGLQAARSPRRAPSAS